VNQAIQWENKEPGMVFRVPPSFPGAVLSECQLNTSDANERRWAERRPRSYVPSYIVYPMSVDGN